MENTLNQANLFETSPNAGQTLEPYRLNIHVKALEYSKPEHPNPALPPLIMSEGFKDYVQGPQSQHFLPGVTAEMLDWFWANMEKGYYLWAPGSHKHFHWVLPPWQVGFEGSAHFIAESVGEGLPVFGGVQINRLGLQWYPFTTSLEHVICEGVYNDLGELVDSTIHTWQNVPGGAVHITSSFENPNISEPPSFVKRMFSEDPEARPVPPSATDHAEYEAGMWPKFLPQLFKLWKNHPDPTQNVQCNLKVEWKDGRPWYVAENGPVVL